MRSAASRAARRRVLDHPRPDRDRHAADRRRDNARRRTVTKCRPDELLALPLSCSECGVKVTSGDDWMRVQAAVSGGTDIVTAPHPGFPTDLQPQMLTFLCTAPGVERRRRIDLQRALLVRQRTRPHGCRRARRDGQQHGPGQRRRSSSPVRRSRRPTSGPARRSCSRGSRPRRDRDHRPGVHRSRLRTARRDALVARRHRCNARAASSRSANRPEPSRPASTRASDTEPDQDSLESRHGRVYEPHSPSGLAITTT